MKVSCPGAKTYTRNFRDTTLAGTSMRGAERRSIVALCLTIIAGLAVVVPNLYSQPLMRSGLIPETSFASILSAGEFLVDTTRADSTGFDERFPAIALSESIYLVAWQDYRNGAHSDVYFSRVGVSGELLDSTALPIIREVDFQGVPCLCAGDSCFLAVWADQRTGTRELYFSPVSRGGEVLAPHGIPLSTGFYHGPPAAAFDGTNFVIVWQDEGEDLHSQLFFQRVTQSGQVLDPNEIQISSGAVSHQYPGLAFDGQDFLVVWQEQRSMADSDIRGEIVSPAGQVLSPGEILISSGTGAHWAPKVAFGGGNFLVVWEDDTNPRHQLIRCARVSTQGEVLDRDGIVISSVAGCGERPSIFFDGTVFVIVWRNVIGENSYILAARVTQSGSVLDPDGVLVADRAGDDLWPVISGVELPGNDRRFLVVWSSSTQAPYARLRIWGKVGRWEDITPVDLWDFEVSSREEGVFLSWKARPHGFLSFSVERKRGGEDSFTRIGTVFPSVGEASGDGRAFTFLDTGILSGHELCYRIAAVRNDAMVSYLGPVVVDAVPSRISETFSSLRLFLPSNPLTAFPLDVILDIPADGYYSLTLFDSNGRLKRKLLSSWLPRGRRHLGWDGKDERGKLVKSGVYFFVLDGERRSSAGRLILLR
ncbi:MAG: hypothetical protein QME66_01990 [Candidatus Eisenbacteria bacterium]|nr:hypothetical protein [Candidatus Eisenbacteria bacterium]